MDSSLESDDSIADPSYIEIERTMKKETSMESANYDNASNDDSNLLKELKSESIGLPYSPQLNNSSSLNVSERIPLIFNGRFFKVVRRIGETDHQKKARGILAQCTFCTSTKIIKGSLNITSNFIQHMKKRHRVQYEEYLREKNEIGKSPRTMLTRTITTTSSSSILNEVTVTDSEFDGKVMAFIVEHGLSPSIVESPSFLDLFDGTGFVVCTKNHLMNALDRKYSQVIAKLQETLSEVSHLCTTLNVWLYKGRYIFGYTCHWINSDYCRKSAALGFRIFTEEGIEKIPEYLQCINYQYGISDDKIVSTITNNDDNVVDFFKESGLNDCYEFDDEDQDQAQILPDLSNFGQRFPKHSQCVIQNLYSLATTDFIHLLKLNGNLDELHWALMKKCSEIWTKCASPEKSEMVKTFVPFSLKFPTSTDWVTLYDAIKCLLNNKDRLDNLCFFLEVVKFSPVEIEYLEEYCRLMEPIAEAFKFLQTESQMLYGYFLPTLVTIKVKLHKLDFGSFKYLSVLGLQMENKLFKRYQKFFEIYPEYIDCAVAAVSCPVIKLKFAKALSEIATNVSVDQIKFYFIEHAREFQKEEVEDTSNPVNTSQEDTSIVHNFFDFGQTTSKITVKKELDPLLNIKREFNRYLADEDNSLSSLEQYPIVKKVFMKYNTPLPSYASVRRMFEYSGVTSSKRNLKLSSRHFERLVIMKGNDFL
ncbi:uncharacterized protein LOC129907693 [Episyrphus balteatus]|uniref:uncharacterized protein LOC129907693 n=1 Tax=Episyrphus balteatus TaxID=286459 RepID=UPI0024867A16|nr:uncharacterized protein LOC129907693 [Episyrphus balteatus]